MSPFDAKAVKYVVHSPLHTKGEMRTESENQGLIATRLLNLVKSGENLKPTNFVGIVYVNVIG